jgi:hypothetical protein
MLLGHEAEAGVRISTAELPVSLYAFMAYIEQECRNFPKT